MPHSSKTTQLNQDIIKLLQLKRKHKYERVIDYAVRVLQYNGFDVHVRQLEQGSVPITTIFACPSVLLDFSPDSLPSISPSSSRPSCPPTTNSSDPPSGQNPPPSNPLPSESTPSTIRVASSVHPIIPIPPFTVTNF
jgi:hypothetical protein